MEYKFFYKIFAALVSVGAVLICLPTQTQELNGPSPVRESLVSQPEISSATNLTRINELYVLVPKDVKFSDLQLNDANFNLFKLNTEVLFDKNQDTSIEDSSGDTEIGKEDEETRKMLIRDLDSGGGRRESRKIKFNRGIWNKQKASPLYLINGTVCRFVNTQPICTTLSTTGLLPSTTSVSSSGSGANTGGGNRPATSGVQSGSSVQFANQQQQQPRPSAVMDDDSQDLNVESSGNLTLSNSQIVRGQQQQQQQQQQQTQPITTSPVVQGARRPLNPFILNRRPLNLMPFRRPIRQFQVVRGRATEQ